MYDKTTYKVLYKWAERLNKWEYSKQLNKNKKLKFKTFSPNHISLELIQAMSDYINNRMTEEEVKELLWRVDVRTELNLCMEAGY